MIILLNLISLNNNIAQFDDRAVRRPRGATTARHDRAGWTGNNLILDEALPPAHCLWQALGMLCRQESLLDGCASGVTACRRTSITSSSGVRIMYHKLVEYLTSCS